MFDLLCAPKSVSVSVRACEEKRAYTKHKMEVIKSQNNSFKKGLGLQEP